MRNMKLLIEIPEEIYSGEKTNGLLPTVLRAIKNGVPFPTMITNCELFKKNYPDIKVVENGSCMWIYFDDSTNHYTMPKEWWNDELKIEKIMEH